jgi:raffinose/stachyose/melibiose transport system substrate-binding protein
VGNQAPDVFIITSENKADLISNGYVKDLTNESFMKNISDANKEFVSKDNKVYGMSTSSWASGIVYNKDLLKKVGVDSVPTTWDGFLALCKKLKAAGITPYLEANADDTRRIQDAFYGGILAKKGTDLTKLSEAKTQTPGTDEKTAYKAWMKLYDQGLVTRDTVGMTGDDLKTQFTGGQVAMITDGAWDFSTFKESGVNWGFSQIPAMEEGMEQYSQGSPSPAWAISSKISGAKLKAAEKFLTFMQSKWSLKEQSDGGDAVTVKGFNSNVVDQYKNVYEKNVKTGKYFLLTNFYSKPSVLSTATQSETQQLVQGSITLDQFATNVDKKIAEAQ